MTYMLDLYCYVERDGLLLSKFGVLNVLYVSVANDKYAGYM